MAPPTPQTITISTFETLYSVDSDASESAKLLRIAQGYKNKTFMDRSKIVNVNVYGYINSEAQMNSVTERNERGAMQTRFSNLRNKLIQAGVPNDKIWIGGVAYSSKWGGEIQVSIKETNLDSITLPPYTPPVPNNPQNPSGAREQWIDGDGSVKKDVLKGELALEIELTFKEGGIFKTKPPVSIKASVNEKGKVEMGAEWTALEEEIKKKAFWGAIQLSK